MPKPEQGRIVRVQTPDPQGRNVKNRPVVIVTPTNEISAGDSIVCVAITGQIPDPLPNDYVLLPYHSSGNSRTGLKKRCAAMCTWQITITQNEIVQYMGRAPDRDLETILAYLDALEE